jgi:hypothetical protein
VNICNALALLAFQSNAVDFVRRLAVLVRLKSCWTNGHDDVMVVCSATHQDDCEVSLLTETRTLVPCAYDAKGNKGGSSTTAVGEVTLTGVDNVQASERKSMILQSSLRSNSGGKCSQRFLLISEHAVCCQGIFLLVFDDSSLVSQLVSLIY